MTAAAERLEFAPPPTAGLPRALALAILAHALLLVALTWGLNWKRSASIATAQAELWSASAQQAAPKPVEVARIPPPLLKATPVPVAPKATDADIALERDKQLRLKKEKQQAVEKLEQEKRKQEAEQKKLALEKQREQAEKLALDKKKEEQEAQRKEALKAKEDAARQAAVAAQRDANLKRMAALAGSGPPSSSGTAAQSSEPSASYAGRLVAKVKPNIVFIADPLGNPTALVEVRAAPDGTIVSRKLLKSSGNKAWDEAVLKAIDKTEVLPRDVDGRVPPALEISFHPKD